MDYVFILFILFSVWILLYQRTLPSCWRPTWWICVQPLRFLILKHQAVHAQILGSLLQKHVLSFISVLGTRISWVPQHPLDSCSHKTVKHPSCLQRWQFLHPSFAGWDFTVNSGCWLHDRRNWPASHWSAWPPHQDFAQQDLWWSSAEKAFAKAWRSGQKYFHKLLCNPECP